MVAMTTIVVSLDPEGTASLHSRRASPQRGNGLHVSLLRCVALTRHLGSILAAVERAAQGSELGGLTLTINRYRVSVNGDPSEVMALEGEAKLARLRSRLVKAIEPGIVALDAAPSICDFRSRSIGPTMVPEFGGHRVGSTTIRLRNVSVFEIDGETYQPRKLLRRWPLSRNVEHA
jgi:hypothetical protein